MILYFQYFFAGSCFNSWKTIMHFKTASKAFDRVWYAGLPHKLKSYGISGQIFDLTSSFLNNGRLWVVLDGKYSQEYPANAGVPQRFLLGPTLFLLYINDLPIDDIGNITIYPDDSTLYSKCDQAFDL